MTWLVRLASKFRHSWPVVDLVWIKPVALQSVRAIPTNRQNLRIFLFLFSIFIIIVTTFSQTFYLFIYFFGGGFLNVSDTDLLAPTVRAHCDPAQTGRTAFSVVLVNYYLKWRTDLSASHFL